MKIPRRVLINGGLAVVIVAALVVAGILLFKPFSATNASATGTQLTGTVQQGTVSSTISASGSIAEARDVNANFAVSGTISAVDVAVGSTVTAGQVLGTLDPTELQATVNTDYTAYVYANQDLVAAEGQPNAQVSQINQAKQVRTQAQATWVAAKADLAKATLTAPIAGLVIAVNGEVGATSGSSSNSSSSSGGSGGTGGSGASSSSSSSSTAFVTIADVSSYIVTANIAEADIAKVTVGQAAAITFPPLTGTTATAKVTAISPTATSSNSVVTYATTITLDKIPDGLRLGQTAEVAITIATSADTALYVPAAAITTANGTSTVKVVDAKTKKTVVTDVTLGVVGDDGTEIKTGLTAGETIVIGIVVPTTTTGTGTGTGTGTRGGFGGGGTGGFGGFGGGGNGGNRTGNNG
ncbi:MAG: efflux RND transporter periplasmic adaptor subunit [Pseudolysinimonas sp.]